MKGGWNSGYFNVYRKSSLLSVERKMELQFVPSQLLKIFHTHVESISITDLRTGDHLKAPAINNIFVYWTLVEAVIVIRLD